MTCGFGATASEIVRASAASTAQQASGRFGCWLGSPGSDSNPWHDRAPEIGRPSAGAGLDGSTSRKDREDRNDQSDDKDEPEEAANSRPAGDRQNDQGN